MKELIISKELIKNVLAKETENLSEDFSFYIDEDYIVFRDEGETLFDYNIYELDFICREWAYTKGFIVEIGVHPIIKQNRNDRDYFYAIKTLNGELLKKSNVDEIMKSEPTATLKACNWILEENK